MSAAPARTPRPRPTASGIVAQWATEPVASEAPYSGMLRTPRATPVAALAGVGLGVMSFLVFAPIVMQVLAAAFWVATGQQAPFAQTYADLVSYRVPFGLVVVHLGLALLLPIAAGLMLVVHRVRPGYLSSVQPGVRWRFLWPALLAGFVTLLGVLALQNVVSGGAWEIRPQADFGWFALLVVLTSPLQAAAEEYFFRGYLMAALGSLVKSPWFGILTSAAVFAAFHGAQQDVPLLLDRFAFGVLAGILVWRTGGVEAGVAAHVANNVCAFLIAGLTTSMADVKAVTVVGWDAVAWDLARFGVFFVVALWLARRLDIRTRTARFEPGAEVR